MKNYIDYQTNQIWVDITSLCKLKTSIDCVWEIHEPYALNYPTISGQPFTKELITSKKELVKCISEGYIIVIDGGKLPVKNSRIKWNSTNKKLLDGYWYIKIADLDVALVSAILNLRFCF